MTIRISLLCVPATAALRAGRFPADELADAAAMATLAAIDIARAVGNRDHVVSSPMACARATAQALGLAAGIAEDLREVDYGQWAGQSLKELAAAAPDALAAWLSDPGMDTHGGESLHAVIARAGHWLAQRASGHTLAVTHASVIRAIVIHALDAPARSGMRLDIAPLTLTTLSGQPGQWRVSAVAVPLYRGGVDGGDVGGGGAAG